MVLIWNKSELFPSQHVMSELNLCFLPVIFVDIPRRNLDTNEDTSNFSKIMLTFE